MPRVKSWRDALGRWISGGHYAQGVGKRFGAFAVITLAFPVFVNGVIWITGARSVGGASGATAMVLGVYLKPILYLWLSYSTLRISLNRAQTIGISPLIGVCIPLLFLADLPFGITFGSFWAVGFSMGIISTPVPASLLTGVIAVVTLSLMRDIDETMPKKMESLYNIWKALLFVSLGLGLLGLFPLLSMWFLGGSGMNTSVRLMRATSYLRAFLIYPYGLLVAFAAASTALILRSRQPSTGGGRGTSPQNRAPLFGSQSR